MIQAIILATLGVVAAYVAITVGAELSFVLIWL